MWSDKIIIYYQRGEVVPPAWHIAAIDDKVLGNPVDVKVWEEESRQETAFTILSKSNGNQEDYDHNTMLTSRKCEDHFPSLVSWIKKYSSR